MSDEFQRTAAEGLQRLKEVNADIEQVTRRKAALERRIEELRHEKNALEETGADVFQRVGNIMAERSSGEALEEVEAEIDDLEYKLSRVEKQVNAFEALFQQERERLEDELDRFDGAND